MTPVDDQRIGWVIRALRRRLGWRQTDLAAKAHCSQRTVSRAEAGHLPSVPVLRAILAALDASLALDVRWRAGALDRLMDEGHAALVGVVSELLVSFGWLVQVEVTYSEYGERGSVDVLAFWPPLGILLVIEVKTDLAGVESTLRKLDEKIRLAPTVAHERFRWEVRHVGWLIVFSETSTLRRRVGRHEAVFGQVVPKRGAEVRRWLKNPGGAIAGLLFMSPSRGTTRIQRHGGSQRVRRSNRQSSSHQAAA